MKYKQILRDTGFFVVISFLLFIVHRLLSFSHLALAPMTLMESYKAFFVGALSDLWVAFLWGFIALLGQILFSFLIKSQKGVFYFFYIFLAITTLLHQNYVSVFRHQVIPFHLTYFTDTHFVAGSLPGLFHFGPMAFLAVSILFGVFYVLASKSSFGHKKAGSLFAALFFISLLAHNRNIHLRVQWFIPTELRVQFWEQLYLHAKEHVSPKDFTAKERLLVAQNLSLDSQKGSAFLQKAAYPKVAQSVPSKMALSLKKAFDTSKRPIIIHILMESLRASEVKAYYEKQKAKTITPHLDNFAKNGLLFHNAFATGTVTRGGQEAVFCGFLGSRNTSMMRNRPDVKLPCLSEILPAISFWFHAGQGGFDNQKSFWRQRQIHHIMTADDFPATTAKTPWGKSDKALFEKSFEHLDKLANKDEKTPLNGMILSLTNHNPWSIPEDASLNVKNRAKTLSSGQFATTLYADEALGLFLEKWAKTPHWRDSLIIITGDHGVAGPPYFPPKAERKALAYQLSHIPLILGGGLIEKAKLSGKTLSSYVSQADIAPLIAYLFGKKSAAFTAEMLLSEKRQRPVLSDLGEGLFAPKLQKTFSKKEQALGPSLQETKENAFFLSYYRSFLGFLQISHQFLEPKSKEKKRF